MGGPVAVQRREDAVVFRQRPEGLLPRLLVRQARRRLHLPDGDRRARFSRGGGEGGGDGGPADAGAQPRGRGARPAPRRAARRAGPRRRDLRNDAQRSGRRQGARLSFRSRRRSRRPAPVRPRLRRARPFRPARGAGGARRRSGGDDRRRAARPRRRRRRRLRPLPRPGDVPDPRPRRQARRLRRPRARSFGQGEIPQLAGERAVSQRRAALQPPSRPQGGARARRGDRRRGLCRRHRHDPGGLRPHGRAARHGADQRAMRAAVDDRRRADPVLRRRQGGTQGGLPRRRRRAAAGRRRARACDSPCCRRARTPTIWSVRAARRRSPRRSRAAEPLAELLFARETEGHAFDTPEKRAGLERRLRELDRPDRRRDAAPPLRGRHGAPARRFSSAPARPPPPGPAGASAIQRGGGRFGRPDPGPRLGLAGAALPAAPRRLVAKPTRGAARDRHSGDPHLPSRAARKARRGGGGDRIPQPRPRRLPRPAPRPAGGGLRRGGGAGLGAGGGGAGRRARTHPVAGRRHAQLVVRRS